MSFLSPSNKAAQQRSVDFIGGGMKKSLSARQDNNLSLKGGNSTRGRVSFEGEGELKLQSGQEPMPVTRPILEMTVDGNLIFNG